MKPAQYLATLETLTSHGFTVTRNAHLLKSYAEFYRWNAWTVQLCATGFDCVESLEVHVFFDSEALAWRNEVKTYTPEQVVSALVYAQTRVEQLSNGNMMTICEACSHERFLFVLLVGRG